MPGDVDAMTCQPHIDALGEYIDGTLPDDRRTLLDAHLAECDSCRALASDLSQIRSRARELPALPVPDAIWTQIASKISQASTAGTPVPARRSPIAAFFHRFASPVPAFAAIALVAFALVMSYTMWPRTPVPAPGHATDPNLVLSVENELRLATEHYEKAIAGLEQIAKTGEGNLDPQVAATLQRNLTVIDTAIKESKQVLGSQPGSQLAQESLFDAFRRKVALLQDTVTLINEIRKGNQAGAARAAGDLGKS
jgi:hypothetical protein